MIYKTAHSLGLTDNCSNQNGNVGDTLRRQQASRRHIQRNNVTASTSSTSSFRPGFSDCRQKYFGHTAMLLRDCCGESDAFSTERVYNKLIRTVRHCSLDSLIAWAADEKYGRAVLWIIIGRYSLEQQCRASSSNSSRHRRSSSGASSRHVRSAGRRPRPEYRRRGV